MKDNNAKDRSSEEPTVSVDEQEFEAAMEAAKDDIRKFTVELKKPFVFEDESYTELSFDFDTLTAADSLAIEAECVSVRRPAVVLELSGEYMLRMLARACTNRNSKGFRLGVDAFRALPIATYNKLRGKARSFLLHAEL